MTDESRPERLFSAQGQRLTTPRITGLMETALAQPGLLSLAAGFTDTATLPRAEIGEAVEAILARPGEPEYLQYGTNQGRPGVRSLLAARLAEQDGGAREGDADTFFVTNGSQQALALALQTLCDPGDIVLVERPTYFVFLELARGLGIETHSLPTRDDGSLDRDAFDRLLDTWKRDARLTRLKAVYLVTYFSNPSSRSLPESEKSAVAEHLASRDLYPALIEDAAYRELYFDEPFPARSLLALPGLERFPRLYTGTCTKPFATGLKVGFAACPNATWRERMLDLKGQQDFGTANFVQAILEYVLESGRYDAYLATLRVHYHSKKGALVAALENEGLPRLGWRWEDPRGGLYVWVRAPEGVDTGQSSPFQRAALENGVLYVPGELCYGDAPPPNDARLSFGVLAEDRLAEAAARFAQTARQIAQSSRGLRD